MIRKTLYLPEEANEKWIQIVKANGGNASKVLEVLVENAYQNYQETGRADLQKKEKSIPPEMQETLRKIKVIENDTNKKTVILLDLINSLITNGISTLPNGYVSAEKEPHAWVKQSQQNLTQKITGLQCTKASRGSDK